VEALVKAVRSVGRDIASVEEARTLLNLDE
jgi:hypothetical protein